MSATAITRRRALDGREHTFRLALAQLQELQESTSVGPMVLLRRLLDGTWHVCDAREIIRLGLVGGGMTGVEAARLVERYADPPNPLAGAVPLAVAILDAAVFGDPDDPPEPDAGNPPADEGTAGSPSPASTG